MLRRILLALALLAVGLLVFLFPKWQERSRNGGQKFAEPFRIAGNFYYVGANDVASFLITSPQGHILLDGGYPGTAPMIMASIARLGFNIKDVKILINTEPHYDHAGGLAELQRASGAELGASGSSAQAIEAGGYEDSSAARVLQKFLVLTGLGRYPAAHVQHRLKDGDSITLGGNTLTAHITGGHTKGCTTWTFPVVDNGRTLDVVSACSIKLLGFERLVPPERYPGVREDFERTFRVLRGLPADIWVTSHAHLFSRYAKFQRRGASADSAAPFIDRAGYLAYIDSGEAQFKRELAKQQREQ
jgi:metallo-beta-lactamase class B